MVILECGMTLWRGVVIVPVVCKVDISLGINARSELHIVLMILGRDYGI